MDTVGIKVTDGLPVLDQFSEDDFVDCVLRITEHTRDQGHHLLRLEARQNGELVGFNVIVRGDMRGGLDEALNLIKGHVYRGGVRFLRSGPESDRLVASIAQLYELPCTYTEMVKEISFTAIMLHRDGVDMNTEPVRIKIFGRDTDEDVEADRYFESFFNLDLEGGWVFWNEKDQGYREPLVRGLSGT